MRIRIRVRVRVRVIGLELGKAEESIIVSCTGPEVPRSLGTIAHGTVVPIIISYSAIT